MPLDLLRSKTDNLAMRVFIVFGLIGLAVIAIVVGYGFVIKSRLPMDEAGQFGDTFGAVNALFSGLAFVGLIAAIWLQRQELAYQRRELTLQRKAVEDSAAAQSAAHQSLAKQVQMMHYTARLQAINQLIEVSKQQMEEYRGKNRMMFARCKETYDERIAALEHMMGLLSKEEAQ